MNVLHPCLPRYVYAKLLSEKYKIPYHVIGETVVLQTSVKTSVFWDARQCSPVSVGRRFSYVYCLHHKDDASWCVSVERSFGVMSELSS